MACERKPLKIVAEAGSAGRILRLSGKYQHDDYETLLKALTGARQKVAPGSGLIVDVTELESLTSSALRAMIQTQSALHPLPAQFIVCGATGVVREVFLISQMDRLLSMADTVQDGERMIREAAPGK